MEASLFHTGIGPDAARIAAARILRSGQWWMVISAGFAGGLDPRLVRGDTVVAELPAPGPRRIISRPLPVETPAEKAALHRETGAQAVDMETETIAAACAAAEVPVLAIRTISDAAGSALPVPFGVWFDLARQRPRAVALAAHLLRHPWRIVPFARFVRSLSSTGEALAIAIEGAIRALDNH